MQHKCPLYSYNKGIPFSFNEARLKGKSTSDAGGLCPPEADAIH